MAEDLTIGIVNNMPDPALESTERQFTSLISEAAHNLRVRVKFYALPGVVRSDAGRRRVASYGDIDELRSAFLDGLIVTGTEPRAAELRDEPYWHKLEQIIDWAEENTTSSVWSCLAAHAAVLHADGIRRQRMAVKRFGVFDCARLDHHELTAGLPERLHMPHSRWNDLPEDALRSSGYRILTGGTAGVDAFVKRGKSLFVFFQGHPEYREDSLLNEYRRDIKRFLARETDRYPEQPTGYFDPETARAFDRVRDRATAGDSLEQVVKDLSRIDGTVVNTWSESAVKIYRNWLSYLERQKRTTCSPRQAASYAVSYSDQTTEAGRIDFAGDTDP